MPSCGSALFLGFASSSLIPSLIRPDSMPSAFSGDQKGLYPSDSTCQSRTSESLTCVPNCPPGIQAGI